MEGRPRPTLQQIVRPGPDLRVRNLMLRTELNLAVFLCAGGKIRVWSECHRLGSFGRIGLFAGVLFHTTDQKRDGEVETGVGSGVASTSDALWFTQGLQVPGLRRQRIWEVPFWPFCEKGIPKPSFSLL